MTLVPLEKRQKMTRWLLDLLNLFRVTTAPRLPVLAALMSHDSHIDHQHFHYECSSMKYKAVQPKQSSDCLTRQSTHITIYNIYGSEMAEIRWTETVEMDRGERVEMKVDIYDSADTVRSHDLRTHAERRQTLQHTGVIYLYNSQTTIL